MTAEHLIPPDFDVTVQCGPDLHTIEVRDGDPIPVAHDSDEERVVAGLAPQRPMCLRACDGVTKDVPEVFQRLARIRGLHSRPAQALAATIKELLATALWSSGLLGSTKVVIDQQARVTHRGLGVEVAVAHDWLARVWLFGIERQPVGVVLSAMDRGPRETEIAFIERDARAGICLKRATVGAPDLYRGVSLRREARA